MSKKQKHKLGDRELDVMQILWKSERATIGEVHKALLEQGEEIAYTTIQTILNRLEAKGSVRREVFENTNRYRSLLKKSDVIGRTIKYLADRFFGDSTEELIVHLVEQNLEKNQLERLQALIDEQRRKGEKL